MAIFGAYETTEELERTPFSVVFRAQQADAKIRSPFVIKTLDVDPTAVDPATLEAKNQQFLSAIRTQQKVSDRSGSCHWAPVHDLGTARGLAFYVTDCYPRTVAGMIKGRVKISARALYSVIRGIVKGLQELNQLCRRPHGNLKTSNVLIADPDLDPTEVYLSDPCPDEQLPAANADAADMKALGKVIYQLVTHRPYPEVGAWPIQMSAEWQRLGRRGKDWLALCNHLLDPLSEKPMTLEQAAAAVKKLGAMPILSGKHVMRVVGAACVAAAAFGIYKFIKSGGTIAKQVSAQTQPEDLGRPRVIPVDPIVAEIQNYRNEIEKRLPVLEGSRDPLLARFGSLLAPAVTMPLAGSHRRMAELDGLSKELVEAVGKEHAAVDRGFFNQQAAVHVETKAKAAVGVEDFQRWLREVKDPLYVRLDEKLDPRKGWQPITALRAVKLKLDELGQMKAGAGNVHQPEVEKLTAAITATRQRRWNNAQKPLIEAEMKELDGRLGALAANVDAAIAAQLGADAKLAQLRAKLAGNAINLSDDALAAEWDKSRAEILEALKKDPGQVDALSKKTGEVQARLTGLDQGMADAARLVSTDDFVRAITKTDELIRAYPELPALRERRAALAGPIYERGMKGEQDEAYRCFILAAGLGDARAVRMLEKIPVQVGAASKDWPAIFDLFKKSAEGGDAAAMNVLGIMHENGWGTPADPKAAMNWYTKSGSANAMMRLGISYEDGRGVDRDPGAAANWYRKAIAAGEIGAAGRLAKLLESGTGVVKDEAEALRLYRLAADGGDAAAMAAMGEMYVEGRGTAKNDAEAFKWTSKAAELKEPSAFRTLGLMYIDGRGTAKDAKKGAESLKRAAEAGDALAAKDVALMYMRGDGVAKDPAEAAKWMRIAADAGDPAAMNKLGVMYLNGTGVAKDEKKALELFRKAASAGDAGAMANLGVMYKNGRGVAKDLYEAFEWYRKAAEANDTLAMNNLGLMYQNGQGTKRDYAAALRWFKVGADAGDPAAMNNLGIMYELGQGVPRNPGEAAKWFKAAAEAGQAAGQKNLDRMERTPARQPPRRDRISRQP